MRPVLANQCTVSDFTSLSFRWWKPSWRRAPHTAKPWICDQCRYIRSPHLPKNDIPVSRSIRDHSHEIFKRINLKALQRSIDHRYTSSDVKATVGRRNDLPSQAEGRRSHISKLFSNVMDHLQSNIFIAGQRLNDLTGYSGIEALKKDIEHQGPLQVCSENRYTE